MAATTSLTLDLGITRPNPSSALVLATTTLTTDTGYARTLRSGPVRTFDGVPTGGGATLELRVEVAAASTAGGSTDTVVQQQLRVAGDGSLQPLPSGSAAAATRPPLHPRLRLIQARRPY